MPEIRDPNPGAIPDAALIPTYYRAANRKKDRIAALKEEFRPILQSEDVYFSLNGTDHFATRTGTETLYFPKDSPLTGQVRYDWRDRGDGIRYGYLKSDEV